MADVVNPQAVDAITIGNVKTIAETLAAANANLGQMAAHSLGLAMQNSVAQQQALNQISNAVVTQAVNMLLNLDPLEAVGAAKVLTGNDVAQQIAQLAAAVSSVQQQVKAAQTTPPVTA
jgi:hypothetical protein